MMLVGKKILCIKENLDNDVNFWFNMFVEYVVYMER